MQIKELRSSQNSVTVNRSLNPQIWHRAAVRPEVRVKLIKIARAFEQFIGIDLDVIDYVITGSNANYTWTKHSDLDLHLIIPGTATDQQRELFTAKKNLWAEQRDITIRGVPVECYVQGQDEPHHSTGVFSLKSQDWLSKPKKIPPKVDDAAVDAKKAAVLAQVEQALLSRDLQRLHTVKLKIGKMRKAGLARAGEWSVENLVFKILRNLGLIDQITELITQLEDQELSLENRL